MNIIAEPYLYHTVQLNQTEDTDDHRTERLIESVSENSARAAHIRTLRVPFFWRLATILPLFVNLRCLHYSTLPNRGLDDPAYCPALASLTNLTHLNWWRPVEDPEGFVYFLEAQHSLQHLTLVAYDVVGIHKRKILTVPSISLMSLQSLTTLDELAVPFLVGRSIRHLQLYAYNPGLFYLRGKSLPSVKTFSCPLSNISWVNHFPELQFLEIREFPMQVTDLARHLHSITNNHLTFVSLVTSNSYLAYLETHRFPKPVDANAYKMIHSSRDIAIAININMTRRRLSALYGWQTFLRRLLGNSGGNLAGLMMTWGQALDPQS
ncbi:hypothetical protein ONZ45_g3903 [Pleurotus djamor]|nr:hypothetical protein ONZ45_g3903 [Pleurotus djamor]